jgi:hypothetical protein
MPEWAIPVMFYSMAVLIIAALIADSKTSRDNRAGESATQVIHADADAGSRRWSFTDRPGTFETGPWNAPAC